MARCAGGQGEREARKTERHPTIADTRGRRVPSECGLVRVGNLAAAAFHVSPCVGILSLQRSRLFPLLHMTNPRPRGASHCENSACTGSKCRKVPGLFRGVHVTFRDNASVSMPLRPSPRRPPGTRERSAVAGRILHPRTRLLSQEIPLEIGLTEGDAWHAGGGGAGLSHAVDFHLAQARGPSAGRM